MDVRIIAATNKELLQGIEDGSFRKDLYYRIQVIPIYLPPLRERRDDILPLARFFVERFNQEFGKQVKGFTPQAERYLQAYDWPGNIRELRNIIEREVILEDAEHLNLTTIPRTPGVALSRREREDMIMFCPRMGWILSWWKNSLLNRRWNCVVTINRRQRVS